MAAKKTNSGFHHPPRLHVEEGSLGTKCRERGGGIRGVSNNEEKSVECLMGDEQTMGVMRKERRASNEKDKKRRVKEDGKKERKKQRKKQKEGKKQDSYM